MLALDQRLAIASPADTAYRARLFRLHSPDDRDALEALLHDRAHIVISDTLRQQLAELVKTRHPAKRLSPSEIDTLTTEALGGRPALEYGAWAYYSWSSRLVHVLDESEFVELRTNRNTYKIAPAERAALATKRIGVVGLSVGQSVAVVLSLERSFGELRLADFDTLDLSNLNRLRAGVHDIGVPKVIVTAREIAEIDPYLHVECFLRRSNRGKPRRLPELAGTARSARRGVRQHRPQDPDSPCCPPAAYPRDHGHQRPRAAGHRAIRSRAGPAGVSRAHRRPRSGAAAGALHRGKDSARPGDHRRRHHVHSHARLAARDRSDYLHMAAAGLVCRDGRGGRG